MAGLHEQIRDHVRQVITLLVAFVVAGTVALLPDVPLWSSLLAAVALLPPLILLTLWIADPAPVWRRRWKRRLAALSAPAGVAVGALVLGASVGGDEVVTRSLRNIEIVLDRSASMAVELEGRPKSVIAADKVGSSVRPLDDTALALRAFGGDCEVVPELVVPFGTRRAGRIEEAASELEPRGRANLVDAVVAASDDFNDPDLYPDGVDPREARNRIVVVTASSDTCGADQTRLEEMVESSRSGVELAYTFIGFGIGDERTREDLRELAAAVDEEALFAESADELDALIDDLVFDGFAAEVGDLTELVNDVSEHVLGPMGAEGAYLEAVAAFRAGEDPAASIRVARRRLDAARRAIDITEPRFHALRRPLGPPAYRELWRLDVDQRRVLAREIARMEELVTILQDDGETFTDEGRPRALWEQFRAAGARFRERNAEFNAKADGFFATLRST